MVFTTNGLPCRETHWSSKNKHCSGVSTLQNMAPSPPPFQARKLNVFMYSGLSVAAIFQPKTNVKYLFLSNAVSFLMRKGYAFYRLRYYGHQVECPLAFITLSQLLEVALFTRHVLFGVGTREQEKSNQGCYQ